MENKMREQEMKKYQNLLQAAQTELDSARVSKAPASAIKHLEQRVEALKERLNKLENFGIEKKEETKVNTTESQAVKKSDKKDKKK